MDRLDLIKIWNQLLRKPTAELLSQEEQHVRDLQARLKIVKERRDLQACLKIKQKERKELEAELGVRNKLAIYAACFIVVIVLFLMARSCF